MTTARQFDAVREMMAASPVGMALLDRDGRYLFINTRLAVMNGRAAAEHLGRTPREILGDAARAIEAAIARIVDGAADSFEGEYRGEVPPGSGRHRWLKGIFHPVRGPDGRVEYVGVAVLDETDRHAAEDRLQGSRAQLERLLEASPDIVARFDRALRHRYVNPTATQASGISRDAMLGRTHRELGLPDDLVGRWEEALTHVFATGEAAHLVVEFAGPAGPRVWDCVVTPEHGVAGEVETALAVVRDVTEVRRSIEALRLSEERFRLAAGAAQDVVYDYDVPGGRIEWNEAMQKVFRYPAEAVEPTLAWWTGCIHPDDAARVTTSLAATLASASEHWTEEYRFRRGDATYARVLERGAIQRDADGRALRMVGSMVDLTERHELEEQLRQAQKMEAVGRLAGGVAHDFNNMLAAITINLRFLADALEPGHPAREELDEIYAATDRAGRLTRQLLALSRKQVLQPRLVDLNEIVRSVGRLLARVIGEHITLELDLAPALAPVLADPGQFEQVLMNLAVNARDAMGERGTLRIATADVTHGGAAGRTGPIPAGDYVALTVSDSGSGMSEATRLRIFEPFYTTKPAGKGTGLGLSTVYGIVRQSGGHITVDSTPGSGTSFTILLPRASGLPQADATAASATDDWRGDGTVLVVEDQASLRGSLRRLLERRGYRVLEAQHGADAVALLEREAQVDLVVTDVVMPEMGGRELAEHLAHRSREGSSPVPIIFMSGYDERAVRADQSLPRGTAFLSKPFEPEELMRRVREMVEK